MKCMPITRSGSGTLAASRVMGIEEVLLARTASWGITCQAGKHLLLDLFVLGDRLDRELRGTRVVQNAGLEPRQGRLRVLRLQLALPTALSSWARMPASPFCTNSD